MMLRGDGAVTVAVLGASGYTGGELVRLLASHPRAEVTLLGARDAAGKTLAETHPHLAGADGLASMMLEPIEPEIVADRARVVFSALPSGASSTLAPDLVQRGVRVIDLAGDFRLPAAAYPEWYGFHHPAPEWLDKAVYGLPELFADQILGAPLIANPGCFATAALLSLAPLLGAGLVSRTMIHVDGKTGLSGAGRVATDSTTFNASEDSIRPYRLPKHQHVPEIERGIELVSGATASVLFVPHLVPAVRGVLTTSYAPAEEGATSESLVECLAEAYKGRRFVRVLKMGVMPDSKRVRGTNVVELQAVVDPRTSTAVVVATVDNLVKGAAGQAIQNMNIALGFEETMALPTLGLYP